MLNIDELEKKWLKYKIKSSIPYLLIAISLIIIIISAILFTSINSPSKQTGSKTSDSIEKKAIEVTKEKEKEKIIKKPALNGEEKLVIEPSLEFINDITLKKNNTLDTEKKKKSIKEKTSKLPKEPQKIDIKRQNKQDDMKLVVDRFNKNNSPTLSLFIAKKYYEQKNYSKSYQYAFITNEIDNTIEESWIIFAKSLVKLGRKDKAINTLKKYINFSQSNQAIVLLEDITSGRFR